MSPIVYFSAYESVSGKATELCNLVVQTVACPYCHAPLGTFCSSRSERVGTSKLNHPHNDRVKHARKRLMNQIAWSGSEELEQERFANDPDTYMEPGEPYATPYPPGDERDGPDELTVHPQEALNSQYAWLNENYIQGPDDVIPLFKDPEPSNVGLFQIRGTTGGRIEAVGKKQVLEGQLDRILTEIDKLEVMGEDVYDNDTVLSIKYKHSNGDKEYDYIALKSGDRWYVTGYQNAGPRTWDKLMEMFSHGEIVGIWMASGWEQIV